MNKTLETLRDEAARSYCKSIQMYYLKRQEGSYDTLMKYEVSDYIVESFEQGWNQAVPIAEARGIQKVIDYLCWKSDHKTTKGFTARMIEEHFADELKHLSKEE